MSSEHSTHAHTSTVTFYGGAGEVTGANTLLNTGKRNILIDCGLYQGGSFAETKRNKESFAYEPADMSLLCVTHAHVDHVGKIPILVKRGFSGRILSTPETKALAEIVLTDAVKIFIDAQIKYGDEPLYGQEEVHAAMQLWDTIPFHTPHELGDDVTLTIIPIGHILGAGAMKFERQKRVFVVSGDIGNRPDVLLPDFEPIVGAHYIVSESVYGDRLHTDVSTRLDDLARYITEAHAKNGTVLIPSFAVHRTQSLLAEIHTLIEEGKIPSIPVYVDSPLAEKATAIYKQSLSLLKDSVHNGGDDFFSFPRLTFVHRREQSQSLDDMPGCKIIIAGSGMSVGGRVLSHEAALLGDPNATVIFVGYQAPGTLGRRIQDGDKTVTIDKQRVTVAARVVTIRGYSGHSDMNGLSEYIEHSAPTLEKVFVIMGEMRASLHFAQHVNDVLGIPAIAPSEGDSVTIHF